MKAGIIFFIGLSLIAALPALAATRTWSGANTNWNDVANWGGALPGADDIVIVPDRAIDPTMPSGNYPGAGAFLSLEIQAGAIVTCLGNTNAINAPSGGTLALPHGTGVAINCQGAVIAGTLTGDGMGFPGWGPNIQYPGPGYPMNWSLTHASHGGCGMDTANTNFRYGVLSQPTALGSGAYHTLSPGGGAIKITVSNTLVLNGRVSANGGGTQNSAASGGSVWLLCNQLAGTGTISAIGGSRPSAAGGGGRISIECQTNSFQGVINVGGGSAANGGSIYRGGLAQPGALWFPKWMNGRESTRTNAINLWMPGPDFGVRYWFPDNTVTQYWNVSMTNSWLELYSGSVAISNIAATNSFVWYETAMSNIVIYGNMFLTNTTLYLQAKGVYDLAGDITLADIGTVVYLPPGDTNAINEDSGGTVGLKHGAGIAISCRNAVIEGKIDGNGKGFVGSTAAFYGGPGQGGTGGAQKGGAYGGRGGMSVVNSKCYGSLIRPTALGSVGSWQNNGGGAVKLTAAGTLTLNGSITVNGTWNSDGGSGGSVWLQAGTFAGTGLVSAAGLDATGYSGGGGRIAIEYGAWNFTGTNSVKCGTAATSPGMTGTVFLCQSPWIGTTSTNGVNGRQLDTQFSVSSNNVRIARSIARFDTSLQWTDYSTDTSGTAVVSNNATYGISGLRLNRGYSVFRNGIPLFARLYTSPGGLLTFTNALDMQCTFFVTPHEKGTIYKCR